MIHFFKDREAVARFVASRARRLAHGYALIIRIEQEKYGDYSVDTVTSLLSEDTPTPKSSKGLDVT